MLGNCYYLYHLPIQLFETAWSDQQFSSLFLNYYHLYFFFFKTCWTWWYLECQMLILGLLYKIIQNDFKSSWMNTWGEKSKIYNFWQSQTITHLNEFRQVNNCTPQTVNISLRCVVRHTSIFILQSLKWSGGLQRIQRRALVGAGKKCEELWEKLFDYIL